MFMPVDRSKPLQLCPLFCHEARPQDGLFGELKHMIDENMTLEQAADFHVRNWNFSGRTTYLHEIAHVIVGLACRQDPTLHVFFPARYNGTYIAENIVTVVEGMILKAYRRGFRPFGKLLRNVNPLEGHFMQQASARLSDWHAWSNDIDKAAWYMAGQSGQPKTGFEMRREAQFDDVPFEACFWENAPDVPDGAINAHGEVFHSAPMPDDNQLHALQEAIGKMMMRVHARFSQTITREGLKLCDLERDMPRVLGALTLGDLLSADMPLPLEPALKVA